MLGISSFRAQVRVLSDTRRIRDVYISVDGWGGRCSASKSSTWLEIEIFCHVFVRRSLVRPRVCIIYMCVLASVQLCERQEVRSSVR